ncbi:polysaccharide biosynthesis/export family protein [Kordiimonas lipolytica]|uniref:Polysaccharide biosynthesis/export family protein n=1 Tax=Kordiimonas lipolytica TaxID=1662421 RepID=A0ABV8UD01_9PROT|nr:polysaccharide biosynthesis/export family protein [Kordiimonas lipolytica]
MKIMFLIASLVGLAFSASAQDASRADGLDVTVRYQLGSGDQIRVTVYGEEDLSGEFELDGTGVISMPLIGATKVGGMDLDKAEQLIAEKLADGYLINPRVSVEVMNYRPLYILGEVKKPGSYPFVNGMTILNAVALASGFTYRAAKKKITITRKVDGIEQDIEVTDATLVLPGDIITVPERFF